MLRPRLGGHVRVNKHSCNDYDEQRRATAKNAHPGRELVHFDDQFLLLFFHVRFSFVQEQLIIFMHIQGTPVDQEDDQNHGESAPNGQQNLHQVHRDHLCVNGFARPRWKDRAQP